MSKIMQNLKMLVYETVSVFQYVQTGDVDSRDIRVDSSVISAPSFWTKSKDLKCARLWKWVN